MFEPRIVSTVERCPSVVPGRVVPESGRVLATLGRLKEAVTSGRQRRHYFGSSDPSAWSCRSAIGLENPDAWWSRSECQLSDGLRPLKQLSASRFALAAHASPRCSRPSKHKMVGARVRSRISRTRLHNCSADSCSPSA